MCLITSRAVHARATACVRVVIVLGVYCTVRYSTVQYPTVEEGRGEERRGDERIILDGMLRHVMWYITNYLRLSLTLSLSLSLSLSIYIYNTYYIYIHNFGSCHVVLRLTIGTIGAVGA